MNVLGFVFTKELNKILGPKPLWFCYYGDYIHFKPTLLGLIWNVLTKYRSGIYECQRRSE
jgi:hypothetical protein